MKSNTQENKPKRSHTAAAVAASMLALAAVLAVLCIVQIKDIENGTVEAVAVQQDGYLELVCDQIALNQDRQDDEIIEDILGTLDRNAASFWAFSKGETMLFVKDATETNRYRNLSADSYFSTQSSADFVAQLTEGSVIHSVIDVNGQQYVASGTVFTYGGERYRLCLLTNRDILLESNAMLGARSRLQVLLLGILALLVVIPIALAVALSRTRGKLSAAKAQLSKTEDALDKAMRRRSLLDSYQVDGRVWREDMLAKFEERARQRGVQTARIYVECRDAQARAELIDRTARLSDKGVLRFSMANGCIALLAINATREQLEEEVRAAIGQESAAAGGGAHRNMSGPLTFRPCAKNKISEERQ